MSDLNGEASTSSSTLSSQPIRPIDPLTVAVQALESISSEAAQAAKKLQGLLGPPVGTAPAAPAALLRPMLPKSPLPLPGPPVVRPVPPPVPTGPEATGSQMTPGQVLHPGKSIFSPNGNYQLAMQGDGNLVLYSGTCALWASNTAGKPVAVCIMQGDGNLVLYDVTSKAVWASNTSGKTGAHLDVQDDGNVVIYETDNKAAWATNTVHTVGSDTLIYRARLKRWTNIFLFGTKGNDTIMLKIPPGATVKAIAIEAVDAKELNPNLSSSIGTQVGNSFAGARLTNVVNEGGVLAITTHWWFDGGFDTEYSIAVWVTGPTAYPVQDNDTLTSANMDRQITGQIGKWFENNEANLIAAATAVVVACVDIATLGTATPVTTPVLIAAISAAVVAGTKVALTPAN